MDPVSPPATTPLGALSQTTPAAIQPVSHLSTIPLEVLLQITRNLKTPDYCNFRLTDKHIEEKLRNAFAREFFTKRQFMLTEFSLRALVDISKSRFSGSLTHVILGLERPSTSTARLSGLEQKYVTFMNSGQDVTLLAEAFSNLPNLETVGMRDFNSRSRTRDHPKSEWRSYGSRTYEQETGQHLEVIQTYEILGGHVHYMDKINHLSRVFLTILRALGESNARPATFEVILRRVSLHDHAFDLPDYILSTVQPVLEQLRTLFLDLNSEVPSPVDSTNPSATVSSYKLRKLLAKTINLEHLRLNFGQYNNKEDMKNFLSWLSTPVDSPTTSASAVLITPIPVSPNSASPILLTSSPPIVPPPPFIPTPTLVNPPLPISLSHLKQLDIGMVDISSPILFTLIKKFRTTLTTISFHRVTLLNPDIHNPLKKVNLWAKFFTQLSDIDIDLRAINMSSLTQGRSSRRNMHMPQVRTVTFKDSRNPHARSWAGSNVKSALRDFTSQVVVRWDANDKDESGSGSEPSDSDHDDDDEDEDEDDEGEGDEDDEVAGDE